MFIPINLVDYLIYSAEQYPDKIAVIFNNIHINYSQMNELTNKVANALIENGLKRGDRVVLCLDNRIETIVLFWAVLKANAIVSIINPNIQLQKLIYIIKDSGAKILFLKDKNVFDEINQINTDLEKVILIDNEYSKEFEKLMQQGSEKLPLRNTIDIDLAAIVYTSGTTSVPKGVMLSHRNMLTASASIREYLKLRHDDIIICALPLSFDYGLYQMILACLNGATFILEKDLTWPIQFIKKIAEEKATVLPGVPTLFSILANHLPKISYDLSSIRCVTNTGAALLQRHVTIIQSLFPKAQIYSMYGLTECKRCTYLPPEDIHKKIDSVGVAIPNTEMWIVDEHNKKLKPHEFGQLVIRGATVMQGYWNKPIESERALKNGLLPGEKVLYTGDYGYLDDDGYFYFSGRMDETIKRYGEKVSLKEIERTIDMFPSVNEVAVIDVPCELTGSSIIVFISTDKQDVTFIKDLIEHCKRILPKTHWPHDVQLVHEIPKNINGKFDKQLLKQQYLNR